MRPSLAAGQKPALSRSLRVAGRRRRGLRWRTLLPAAIMATSAACKQAEGDGESVPAPAFIAEPSPVSAPRRDARILISGHSLTEAPMPHYLAAVAESLGTPALWNQQNLPGSSLQQRTRGDGAANAWVGYRSGNNREGQGLDLLNELRAPRTLDRTREPYDVLVVTEIDALLDFVVGYDTVRYLRHFHDRFIEGNRRGTTYLYEAWLGVSDKDDPRRWIAYERAASPAWRCVATRINRSLAHEGRSDRVDSIPAGAALASLVERATSGEGLPGLAAPTTRGTIDRLFTDDVHLTPLGMYYVALVTYATIYRRSPVGGWAPAHVTPEQAGSLQDTAWRFVAPYLRDQRPQSLEACRDHVRHSFLGTYLSYQRDTAWRARGTAFAYALWAKHHIGWRHLLGTRSTANPLYFDPAQDRAYWFPPPGGAPGTVSGERHRVHES